MRRFGNCAAGRSVGDRVPPAATAAACCCRQQRLQASGTVALAAFVVPIRAAVATTRANTASPAPGASTCARTVSPLSPSFSLASTASTRISAPCATVRHCRARLSRATGPSHRCTVSRPRLVRAGRDRAGRVRFRAGLHTEWRHGRAVWRRPSPPPPPPPTTTSTTLCDASRGAAHRNARALGRTALLSPIACRRSVSRQCTLVATRRARGAALQMCAGAEDDADERNSAQRPVADNNGGADHVKPYNGDTDAYEGTENSNGSDEPKLPAFVVRPWIAVKRFVSEPVRLSVPKPIAIVVAVFGTILLVSTAVTGMNSKLESAVRQKSALFSFVLHDLVHSYVDPVDVNKLFEAGVDGMLSQLDPYTQFEGDVAAREMRVKTSGQYGGVGLGIARNARNTNEVIVLSAFEGYAFDRGVRVGDVISKVDGVPVFGKSLEEVTELLRGEPGSFTRVELAREVVSSSERAATFTSSSSSSPPSSSSSSPSSSSPSSSPSSSSPSSSPSSSSPSSSPSSPSSSSSSSSTASTRTSSEPSSGARAPQPEPERRTFEVVLPRRQVLIRDVPLYGFVRGEPDGVGYVRMQSFASKAGVELRAAINSMARTGRMKTLVLDLRDNPGGLLNSAVEATEALVPKNSHVVSTRGRAMGETIYTSNSEPALPPDVRLVVLVNEQTASAAEIVAGAVQDLDRGVVAGTKTFGKGLVQNVQQMPYRTALKYTVGKYYTPSGRCIQSVNYDSVQAEGSGSGGGVQGVPQLPPPQPSKRPDPQQQSPGTSSPSSLAPDAHEPVQVPESARREFRTANGRVVRDAGGIEPDLKSTPPEPSELEIVLTVRGKFFYFANQYAARHASLPEDFEVSDKLYREFQDYVVRDSDAMKFGSRFEPDLRRVEQALSDSGFSSATKSVDAVRERVADEIRRDFSRHDSNIRHRLEDSIRMRFDPESKRLSAALRYDSVLKDSVSMLGRKGDGAGSGSGGDDAAADKYTQLLAPGDNGNARLLVKAAGGGSSSSGGGSGSDDIGSNANEM